MEVCHGTATECHLPYGITQCYLLPDTSEHTRRGVTPRLNPSHAGRYSIYLPRRDGRLSWPSWLDSAPAGSRTSDLSITSPTLNQCNHQDNVTGASTFVRSYINYFWKVSQLRNTNRFQNRYFNQKLGLQLVLYFAASATLQSTVNWQPLS